MWAYAVGEMVKVMVEVGFSTSFVFPTPSIWMLILYKLIPATIIWTSDVIYERIKHTEPEEGAKVNFEIQKFVFFKFSFWSLFKIRYSF